MKAKKALVVWESVESSNKKKWDVGSGKYISLNFAKYLSYSEVQKNRNVLGTDFRKLGNYSKPVTKSFYGNFLVGEGIFKLVCYCAKCR